MYCKGVSSGGERGEGGKGGRGEGEGRGRRDEPGSNL